MRFSISSGELLKKLQVIGGAIASNPVMPVLEDFLFQIKGKEMTITASDLDVTVQSTADVNAEADMTIAIPGKILLETLKSFPEQPLTFTVDPTTMGVGITSDSGKYRLAGESGEDFPDLPQINESDKISLPTEILKEAIESTLFATSTDEMRLAMTGVYFEIDMSEIGLVATDAHKLVKYTIKGIEPNLTTAFIIPRKGLTLLKNALPSEGETVLTFSDKNAFFQFGDTIITCRLIDERFPQYNNVIPSGNTNVLSISRTDFLSSLRRIAIYANKSTNQVSLDLSEGSLTISAQDLDFSNEATEQLTCKYEGEPLNIHFNARFLAEMLAVLKSEEIRMEMSKNNVPGLLFPDTKDDQSDVLMLIMPVMTHQ